MSRREGRQPVSGRLLGILSWELWETVFPGPSPWWILEHSVFLPSEPSKCPR